MRPSEEISLLGYLDTPILVGDPEGCIVYANPCFRRCFAAGDEDLMGRPLAMVFGGGAREVMLSATAAVLDRGEATRLQIREGGIGYTGLASPIEAEHDRVGVVMLLLEEQSSREHLMVLADEIGEPLSEALSGLRRLVPRQAGGAAADGSGAVLEGGIEAIEGALGSLRELTRVLRGGKPKLGRFDLPSAVRRVVSRIGDASGEGAALEVLMPPDLPRVAGNAAAFERVMGQLLRQRMHECRAGHPLTLLARGLGRDGSGGVLVSVVDVPDPSRREATGLPPEAVSQGISGLGGEAICVEDSTIGRVTTMRLAVASV